MESIIDYATQLDDDMNPLYAFIDHLDALYAGVNLPDGPITAFDGIPGWHVYTVYDCGKIQYRVALYLKSCEVFTFKYDNDGSLIGPISMTGSTFFCGRELED